MARQNTLRLNDEDISASDRHTGKQLFPKAVLQKPLEFASESARAKDKDLYSKPSRSTASTPTVAVSEIVSLASDMERKANVSANTLLLL